MSLWQQISALHTTNPNDTHFREFQELIFNILQTRGIYVTDITLDHITPEERVRIFEFTNGMWNQIREYRKTVRPAKDRSRRVSQFTLDGAYIDTFPSIKQAAKKVGCYPAQIWQVCQDRKNTAYGFMWAYADEPVDK